MSAEATSTPTLSYETACKRFAEVIEHSGDTGDWLKKYATEMDVISDGSVITWQRLALYETSGDHTAFESLWSNELRRVGPSSYQIHSEQIPEQTRRELRRRIEDDEERKREEKRNARKKEDEARLNVLRSRRAAGRCEICGHKIWFLDRLFFRVYRSDYRLMHKECSGKPDVPINLSRRRGEM